MSNNNNFIKNIHSSESNEWYTPVIFTEAARAVMGEIDLDPASSEEANEAVRAGKIFTIEDDGFTKEWFGRVWLNSPYGFFEGQRGVSCAGMWAKSLRDRFLSGEVEEALMLVNANVGDKWWMALMREFPVCLVNKRIAFRRPSASKKKSQPSKGNSVFYFGNNFEKFRQVFEDEYNLGIVVDHKNSKNK
ncbi:DNA N-6-adenine-methyltransferase [Aeromonas sp. MrichA-1]|uniref:DNA N-6-adenine-methyltransferase n=1 Tax=Aeromonas sp. MrichA-1 TaxID=2823362 RepID=UPI001B322337|nr:DNA N-6-adenine-methyltransferase [Aeromonas sp. MrichA-1]MBP4081641.1 hypothetical protein [Aeromonas sp. MrichA-1]